MDYLRFLSSTSLNRKASGISEMRTYLQNASPSLVWLASGVPNAGMFPFKKATITLEDGQDLTITPEVMATVLQYGPTPGYVPFVKQLKAMSKRIHNPPCWDQSDVIVTAGCQEGLSKAVEMLLDPGDYVVVQEPCYSDALCILSAVTPKYLKVEADGKGMCPVSLKNVLQQTAQKDPNRMPKAMYIVPNACNPTGTTMDETRKKEIYSVASEYNIIILEDDPYYYLQYNDEKELPPSFLSLDKDGRVLRFDSFSKILSAGLRIGYVTGPKFLIDRMVWHMQASTICTSGMSQVMVSELLREWGEDGFNNHITKLRQFYKSQRDAMLLAADTHLKGLCEWTVPSGGIFVWFKVPALRDTQPMLKERGVKKDVLLVPGKDFMLEETKPCQFMRAAYSNVTPQQMMVAMKNLAELIKEEIVLQKSNESA